MLTMSERRTANENAAKGVFNGGHKAYSDTAFSYSASVLNTPIMLIDPETNHNGMELLNGNVIESSAAALPFFIVLVNSKTPNYQRDGDAILSPDNGQSVAGNFLLGASLNHEIYVPPNHGLFLYPLVASASGSRQFAYRLL